MYELCASMMCAKFDNLSREVKTLEEAGIDSFHIDIMDGQFVPNFGMGLQDLAYIRKVAKKPVDIHLMIKSLTATWIFSLKIRSVHIYTRKQIIIRPLCNILKQELCLV